MEKKNSFTDILNIPKNLLSKFRESINNIPIHFDFSVPKNYTDFENRIKNFPGMGMFNQFLGIKNIINEKFVNKNNDDNNQSEEKHKQSDHLRGLVNIANTCYMNSTIQCFAHIKELFNYFQKPKMTQLMSAPGSKEKLYTVFGELIICLWNPYDSSPLYPYIFKENLGKMNSLFQGPIPNDAKDLLTFILMQLHDELNHSNNINNNFNQMNIPNANMQKDQRAMFNLFIKDFQNNNRSIISDLFFGLNYNRTECLFCRTALYNYQTFNFLIFPLAEVLNYKNKFTNNMNYYGNTVTLDECFQYNQSYSPLNEYYCNICNRNSQGQYATFLSVLPNIIIIILNRGVGLQYNVKIDFEENLNLQNYVEYFREDSFYELIGLVPHYGESGASGHFIARCKSPIDGFWYLYNDAIIQKIGYFTKEEFHQGNPYILFYKKTKFG